LFYQSRSRGCIRFTHCTPGYYICRFQQPFYLENAVDILTFQLQLPEICSNKNKNSVTLRTANQQRRDDSAGRARKNAPTPRSHFYNKHLTVFREALRVRQKMLLP
jgi:hypothetical protein